MSDQSRKLMSDADEQRRHNREASERLDQESGGRDGMSKHTPGPWSVVDEGHAEQGRPAHVRALRLHIVVDHAEDFGDPAPDARLIAAAPDLLAACKMISDMAVAWEALTPGDQWTVTTSRFRFFDLTSTSSCFL